jgi:hypothetical protein
MNILLLYLPLNHVLVSTVPNKPWGLEEFLGHSSTQPIHNANDDDTQHVSMRLYEGMPLAERCFRYANADEICSPTRNEMSCHRTRRFQVANM